MKILFCIYISFFTYFQDDTKECSRFYVEVTYDDNKNIISGEYLLDIADLRELLSNPYSIWRDSKYTRLFNYNSFYFLHLPISERPDNITNLSQINWNCRVSLEKEISGFEPIIYKSLVHKNYTFHIKDVRILAQELGSVKDLRNKNYDLEFLDVHSSKITNVSASNVLVRKIIDQKNLNRERLEALGLTELIKKIK